MCVYGVLKIWGLNPPSPPPFAAYGQPAGLANSKMASSVNQWRSHKFFRRVKWVGSEALPQAVRGRQTCGRRRILYKNYIRKMKN